MAYLIVVLFVQISIRVVVRIGGFGEVFIFLVVVVIVVIVIGFMVGLGFCIELCVCECFFLDLNFVHSVFEGGGGVVVYCFCKLDS